MISIKHTWDGLSRIQQGLPEATLSTCRWCPFRLLTERPPSLGLSLWPVLLTGWPLSSKNFKGKTGKPPVLSEARLELAWRQSLFSVLETLVDSDLRAFQEHPGNNLVHLIFWAVVLTPFLSLQTCPLSSMITSNFVGHGPLGVGQGTYLFSLPSWTSSKSFAFFGVFWILKNLSLLLPNHYYIFIV